MMVVLLRETSSGVNDCVLIWEDNSSAVQWVNLCRVGKDPRAGALMRFLGFLQIVVGDIFRLNISRA